jgi:DNA polymerase III subunit epsilon
VTWWTGAAIGFDTETDGSVPQDARIITGALVYVSPGNAPVEMEQMIQPERDIPAEATAVHGITTGRAMAEGVLREVGVAQIVATIAEIASPDIPVVGHNASYDLTLLDREMRRLGIGFLELDPGNSFVMMVGPDDKVIGRQFPVIDTYVLDKAVDRYRPGKRKLEVTARHYGVPMAEGSAHGATADVIASLRIAITIAKRCAMPISKVADLYMDRRFPMKIAETYYNLGAMSLAELHCAQVAWAAEQADGLREHFRQNPEKGVDPDDVSGDWPLRVLTEDEMTETVSTTV